MKKRASLKRQVVASACVLAFALLGEPYSLASARQLKRPFTLVDDIGYTHFVGDAYSARYFGNSPIIFSPDGNYFAVLTARGRLELDQVEESVRIYRTEDVEAFLKQPAHAQAPSPVRVVNRLGKKEPICNISWLPDSSGVALLEYTEGENERIVLADLRNRSTKVLTEQVARNGNVGVSDAEHYVYLAEDEGARKELEQKRNAERRAPMSVFTGSVWDLVIPDDPGVVRDLLAGRRHLWAVLGRQRFEVQYHGAPLSASEFDLSTLALSPDGQSLVTRMNVKDIPKSWERLYPPPYSAAPYNGIHAGGSAFEFVLLNLKTGAVQALTEAPTSGEAGWTGSDNIANWSKDGHAIVLSGTFIAQKDGEPSRPCVAVVDLTSRTSECVEKLKGRKGPGLENEEGYHYVLNVRFVAGNQNQVEINFMDRDESAGTIEYRRSENGDWQVVSERKGQHQFGPNGLEITVKQGFNQPPLLVASDRHISRVIWDPNPQFKDLDLGQVKVYKWKGKDGEEWTGGLYLPADYQPGQRYPLVIQTHGFSESVFLPSGSFPTAFAARELAAAGIAVLQVGLGKKCGSPIVHEASCEVAGFQAGARQLAADGLVDLQNVGYIGFSHSCWYGLEMLTNGSLPLKTALLEDGITVDYFEFALFGIDFRDYTGAKPFGEGLETWVKNSPGFHLDRVNAPVLIATEHPYAIEMWQPFSVLRYLNKPVELELTNTDEHVITNPVERLASQGLSVDWFRFWLQGYEDPAPAKADQYKRWRGLRELQANNNKKSASAVASAN